ncbi:MAG: hypothetical protein WA435_01075 [Gallionellaceae bacterium]
MVSTKKYGASVADMLVRTVEVYMGFIQELSERYEVIVVSTALPTIVDGASLGEVVNARKEITASQKARTDLTLEFNRLVNRHCHQHGWLHVNVDIDSLGPDGLVRSDLLSQNQLDHHYDQRAYAELLAGKIKDVI